MLTRFVLPLVLVLTSSVSLFAQASATPVRVSPFPAAQAPTTILDNTGTGNGTLYVGYAKPDQPTTTWSVAATTLTNVVVLTNTGTVNFAAAHGLKPDYKLVLSGSGTTALNGTYRVLTVPTTTSLTITTSGVADATYTTGLVATTDAPRTTLPIWSINKLHYDSNGNVDSSLWAGGNSGNFGFIWDNRAQVNGATVVTYK